MKTRAILIANPNNPTGGAIDLDEIYPYWDMRRVFRQWRMRLPTLPLIMGPGYRGAGLRA